MILEENESRKEGEKKLILMYDQMYWHLTYGNIRHYNPVSLRPAMRDCTVYIDAISKVFSATGVRVGWAFGPSIIIDKMKAILSHIGAWAPMAEQKATAAFLPQREKIDEFLGKFKTEVEYRLKEIYAGFMDLKKEGFKVDAIPPQAAIYLTIRIDLVGKKTRQGNCLINQNDVTSYILDEAKLAVVPFSSFGASKDSSWYRLSVGTCRKEEIQEMLKKLREAMQLLS
jgi:aspartate aminotransferase